jgi:DNA-binding CsgD family transcriptional regulator/tetratricopeptide (TPR) repeat protein
MACMADVEPRHGVSADQAPAGAVALRPGSRPLAERLFVDRQREQHAVNDLLDLVRDGFSSVLVFRGDHGTGKTSLVNYAVRAAAGSTISTVIGVESERAFAFGAAQQLLTPFLGLVGELPVPQRQALNVAFGLQSGPSPDPFLVGLGCLTLLSRSAEAKPVLCTVDDAHWIDAESALVIGFVARRLYADRVGMILTLTCDSEPGVFEQLPTIELGGLPDDAAAELLQSVAGSRLGPQLVDRVLADTGRNALALVDIGSNFTTEELAERAYRPEPMPVGRQLQRRYLWRLSTLPADAREFVLLIAASGSGPRARVRQAAATAHIDPDAAEAAAEAADLIEVSGNSLLFRHPLIRAAVYNGATDADRRRAHRLLGEIRGRGQLWDRAAAAAEPDEGVAADLQAAAARASGRGAWGTAAGLLRRSIELTPDQGLRARREVGLAEAELVIGHPDIAQQVADAATPRLPGDGTRGRAQVVSGESLFAQGRDSEAADVLADASAALSSTDPASAADALLSALTAAIWAGPAETARIARMAVPERAAAESNQRVSDLLLAGFRARANAGYGAAVARLRDALHALSADDLDPDIGLRWFSLGVIAAGSLWDDRALVDMTDSWVRLVRRLGALSYLPFALSFRALADWLTGRLGQADDRWEEMRELIRATHGPEAGVVDNCSKGIARIYHGDLDVARTEARAQIREATARGQGLQADIGRAITAIANLTAGECEAAADTALSVVEHDPPYTTEMILPELVQAAICSGNRDTAAKAFAILDGRATASGTAWALGVRARCLGLISDGKQAEDAYLESITQLEHSLSAVDLARAHLLYGQWLRRAKRRREARRELRTAEAMYNSMGADGFAVQARAELRASGERARSRTPETAFDLTPQEARVASLAAEGSTNSEIAEQLFISPGTVEYHLVKVFRKLGVSSRSQLVHRLPG